MNDLKKIDTHGNIFGIALNYKCLYESLQTQFNQKPYVKEPVKPVLFIKTPNTRNQSGQVVFKQVGDVLQAGPTVGVVVNELSLPEDSYYRPAIKAKCQDGFCVIGEAVARDQVTDINHLELRVLVNGELKQKGNTSNWLRTPEQIIAEVSEYMPLNEGDVILTGTPLGRVDLNANDVVRIEIDQLGAIENTIQEQGV